MSRVSVVALLASFLSLPAAALPVGLDTDGDGLASLTELQTKYPDITSESFAEIDTDADGFVNDEEMVAAVEAKLLPEPKGDE